MSGTNSQVKTYPSIEHARIQKELYMPNTNPENTFWHLFHEREHSLLATACRGISKEYPCTIEISTTENSAAMRVSGGDMPREVHSRITEVCKRRTVVLDDFYPFQPARFVCREEAAQSGKDDVLLPIWLVLAYSEMVTIVAVHNKKRVEVSICHDEIVDQSCHDSDEEDFFQLQFKPNPNFISSMPIDSAFRSECFRCICAYSNALSITLNGVSLSEQ